MKKKLFFPVLALALASCLLIFLHAKAAFNPNRIIDDSVFSNSSSMSAGQIDTFLNGFPNSCISPNSGFEARVPSGYSPGGGFTYGNFGTAGNVIATSAQVYNINPQVLLVTLQKEQSLVAGAAGYCNDGNEHKYAAAVGYGCPDGGTVYSWTGISLYRRNGVEHTSTGSTCVNSASKAGFAQQVIRAAWLLKFGQQRSLGNVGWAVIVGPWDNSDDPQSCYGGPMTQGLRQVCPSGATTYYDGYRTIDGTAVHMDTGATAALYWYTPHFHGNQNFSDLFSSWFGSLYGSPYYAVPVSESAYPALDPGQQTTSFINFQNSGTAAWYDNQGLGGAPAGTAPVHLATAHNLNRGSFFNDANWATVSRPALNFAAVYEADGTTLAGNQHVAQPGQIVKFSFTLTAPDLPGLSAGTYREFFQPVAEGTGSGSFNDTWSFFNVTVNPKTAMAWYSQSGYPTILPGDKAPSSITFTNTGNTVLYDEAGLSGTPAGTNPVHLATDNPLNRISIFGSDWPTSSRPALNFAAVYNSDGSLTGNQHAVGPGQRAKFSFNLTVPAGQAANSYSEYFKPVLEGTSDGGLLGVGAFTVITVPTSVAVSYTNLPNPAQLTSNSPGTITITVKNVGNATLSGSTKLVTSNGSPFKDSTWQDNSVIAATIGADLAPLASRNISFSVLSPSSASWPNTPLTISLRDGSNQTIPLSTASIPINLASESYLSGNVTQSGYPAFTYGQTQTTYFMYKNVGNQYWYDSASLSSATTRNPFAVHLATYDPLNRSSGFASGWPTASRPALNFAAVYEADGITLAGNQHVAQPGQIVKFQFQITPSVNLAPGVYREFFNPIAEGSADGIFPKAWTFIDVTVQAPNYTATPYNQSAYPQIPRGQQTNMFFMYKNNGNIAWFDETGLPQGPSNTLPIHLATTHNLNRGSFFNTGWTTVSRPALNFATVYEADGVTLAGNQHVAQPGQIVKFSFTLTAPGALSPGVYREFFNPIAEGSSNGAFNDTWTFFDVTVQ
jgi:hypothetical protein